MKNFAIWHTQLQHNTNGWSRQTLPFWLQKRISSNTSPRKNCHFLRWISAWQMRDISREIPSFYDFSSRHIIFRHVKQDGCYSVTSQSTWPQGMLTRAFQNFPCACYGSERGCRQRKSQSGGFYLFFFLRENRRCASKGFFLAWLNSGKKQTRLTTRLVVFGAFSASRHKNGFVADYDAIDKPRERRLRSHARKKPLDTQCRGFRLLVISEIMSAYHLYEKPRNSVENSNGTVHPGGNFPEKK